MALIVCPECGEHVSQEAAVCPHCGKKMLYCEDAVIANRMTAGFGGPIVGIIFLSSIILSIFITGIAVGGTGLIVCTIISFVCAPILLKPIFELINRIKNNTAKTDVMVYKSDTDEFEINNIKDEPFRIKRTSLFRVKCGPKSFIYYYDEKNNLVKRKMFYVGNYNTLRSIVMKYMDKYNK